MAWSKPTDERNACVRVESDRGEKSTKFFRRELRGFSHSRRLWASRKPSRQVSTRIRMRIVRYLGAYIAPERHRCSHPAVIHPIHHTLRQHRSLGRIVLRRAFLTSDATATLSFMSVIVSADPAPPDGANTPFQTSRTPGKLTDEKEACETSRPKIEKTTLKAG